MTRHRAPTRARAEHSIGFEKVVVALDVDPASTRVVERVARLPFAAEASVALLHVVSSMLPRTLRKAAEHDARARLHQAASVLARARPDLAVEVRVAIGAAAEEIVDAARSARAALTVTGRGGGRPLRDAFIGSTAERILRQGRTPVLLVRRAARSAYRNVLMALDLDASVHAVMDHATRIAGATARIAWVHAFDVPYRALSDPSAAQSIAAYRDALANKARAALERSIVQARRRGAVTEPWASYVVDGSPRAVIEKIAETSSADVVVMGTRARAGLGHAFLGTVAGDVLRSVKCDALVVPAPARRAKT